MKARAIFLSLLLVSVLVRIGAAEPKPRVFAILAELDRLAAQPFWPGFEPRKIPLEVFDDGRTWLLRHPGPPAEFAPVPGHAAARVFEGRHESMRANTAVELGGVATATASFEGRTEDPRRLAALLLHEAFHVFQARRHPSWGGNEVDLFVYPVEDSEGLALRRLESRALQRALDAGNRESTAGWAARALELRRNRFARLPASAVAYERGTETKEGLARYIEAAAAGLPAPLLPDAEFAAAEVRDRAYASGCAIALLLDRLDPGWKQTWKRRTCPWTSCWAGPSRRPLRSTSLQASGRLRAGERPKTSRLGCSRGRRSAGIFSRAPGGGWSWNPRLCSSRRDSIR